jgi:hypothetical protein
MKRKSLMTIMPALMVLPACIIMSSCCKSNTHLEIIPLKAGNYWVYKGNYSNRPVTLNISVTGMKKRGNLTFALLKGFPADILSGEDWEPSTWGLLVTGDQHYYRFNSPKTDSVSKAFSDSGNVLAGLFCDSELFMPALSDTGQTFGEASQLTRDDGNYFWKVTEKHAYDASSIKVLKLSGPFDRFTLAYKTLADEIIIDMVPGIGIVRYRYSHHGTPCELDIKLIEADVK